MGKEFLLVKNEYKKKTDDNGNWYEADLLSNLKQKGGCRNWGMEDIW